MFQAGMCIRGMQLQLIAEQCLGISLVIMRSGEIANSGGIGERAEDEEESREDSHTEQWDESDGRFQGTP